jgi:acetyl/propionyl-CoA carboxylase alpha subunit
MEAGCKDAAEALREAERIGYPVMLKAAAGGGGKGIRAVETADEMLAVFENARAEAVSAFGDSTVFIEKQIVKPRHVEFQILADQHGACVHLNERECSIQRRHQKLVEESPSAMMTPELRRRMGEVAVKAALASGYTNAGTVEFLVDANRDFYFLEVNARLQVEHPVTEMVTGIDLVKAQFRVASGDPLALRQEDVRLNGSAIECRICAEDPYEDFFPSSGVIELLVEPAGPGVRVESGLREGQEVSLYYDPLVAKLIVWAATRDEAIARMRRALSEYQVYGIKTTIPFHRRVIEDKNFALGDFDTSYVDQHRLDRAPKRTDCDEVAAIIGAMFADMHKANGRAAGARGVVERDKDPWKSSVAAGMVRTWGRA